MEVKLAVKQSLFIRIFKMFRAPYIMSYFLFVFFSLACSSDLESITISLDENGNPASAFDDGTMRNITSIDVVSEMKTGWNLGNSLDVEGPDETYWGNPATTKTMIDSVSARGFKTLRVPVTWRFHQGPAPNYLVEANWLDRVEEIVNYGRANNMYVILNVHHDDTWIIPTYDQADEVKDRLSKLWTQVAERFKNYSDFLIFQTLE